MWTLMVNENHSEQKYSISEYLTQVDSNLGRYRLSELLNAGIVNWGEYGGHRS